MEKRPPVNAFLDFLVAYWVPMVGVLGAVVLACCVLRWKKVSATRKIIGVFVVVLALHMIEEYAFPGGFHYAFNIVQGSANGNAYPLNTLSAMVTNLVAAICFASIFFAKIDKPWVLLLIAFFGIGQAVIHTVFGVLAFGLFSDAGMAFPYTPGMANSIILMLPLSIVSIVQLAKDRLLDKKQVALAILAMVFLVIGLIRLPVIFLGSDPATTFVFADAGFYQRFL